MRRRTLTMDWNGLGEMEDDDRFFESYPRISSVDPTDLCSSGSDDDEEQFEDSRMSFVSAISTASARSLRPLDSFAKPMSMLGNYDMWVSEPGDIRERRKRLLQGMGLASRKDMLRVASAKIVGAVPRAGNGQVLAVNVGSSIANESKRDEEPRASASTCPSPSPSHPTPVMLVRSRSDGDLDALSAKAKQRKEELMGPVSKHRLTRTSSEIVIPSVSVCQYSDSVRISPDIVQKRESSSPNNDVFQSDRAFGSFFLIKSLDSGKEFIVKEHNEQGLWNKLRDLQTGKQLTMEEFEKSVGHSPVVKELMRREQVRSRSPDDGRKMQHSSYLSKSFRNSKKKGAAILKNIKGVATSMSGLNKEYEHSSTEDQKSAKTVSQWVKARQQGKSYKEFTALHMTQDIHAHEGSIWTIKFSCDAHLLASAGEDKVIHVWEVQEFDVTPTRFPDDMASGTPIHPMVGGPPLAELTPMPSEKKKKSKSIRKKGNSILDYVNVPETVFALSEKPVCTFKGHQEDVLDLSWSKSQLLLSSSMDKTVRLWDLRTKTCLKMFPHNDYVTCIQFNPVNDNYFMSGSLDAKLRIWSIPDRQVVDWADLHEMVTAASYTPDGQGAIVGSHLGVCRFYTIGDCKLEYRHKIQMSTKSQAKKLRGFHSQGQTRKITGFQFSPYNPAEVLITSTDSRIRIHNGSRLIRKYRGFRNTSSQIAASFSPDGQHVISASEDSQVYVWKLEESRVPGGPGKKKRDTVQAHEHFHCKDVSIAIPWPGSIKNDPPLIEIHSKRHSKRVAQQHVASPPHDHDAGAGSRRHLPPIPRKNNFPERNAMYSEEDLGHSARMDPGIGLSSSFDSSSFSYTDPVSISSHSWASSRFEFGSGHHQNTVQATAWGMVIVAASLEGEIRVYQNFGLPFKVGRQPNLF